MISGQASVEMAVRATRLGAVDFLEKPLSTDKLLLTVDNVLKLSRLEEENRQLRRRVGKHEIVRAGEAMRRIMAQVERVAASESRVCILGETGTGKELIARTIHDKSPRRAGPFVTLNCAAVPGRADRIRAVRPREGRVHRRGRRHAGKFEQAHHGTLFLDEIGDMPLAMQAKLLRVLEEGEVERVGGDRPMQVDVRVVVATHRNLEALVKQGGFRQDLFHRVYVFPGDPAAAARAPRRYSGAGRALCPTGGGAEWMEADCVRAGGDRRAEALPWPGNVRELRNVVERLMLLSDDGRVARRLVESALPAPYARSGVNRNPVGARRGLRARASASRLSAIAITSPKPRRR